MPRRADKGAAAIRRAPGSARAPALAGEERDRCRWAAQPVASCLRQIDFLDEEIAEVDRALARAAVGSQQLRRLINVPGVNLHTAATLMACVGDIRRFKDPRKLVSYLGLDPKVRQSGQEWARHGHISPRRAPRRPDTYSARRPGSWSATRARCAVFSERIRARRGAGIATVAVARKLVVPFWHLLTKEADYAFARPTRTRRKLRRLELLAGAERRRSGGRPKKGAPSLQGAAAGRD